MKNFLSNKKNITKTILVITAIAFVLGILVSSFVLQRVIARHDQERMKFIAADIYDDINTELLKLIMIARVMSKDIPLIEQLRLEDEFGFELNVERMANYLTTLKKSFNLSTGYIVSDKSKIYYSPEGFNKFVDVDHDKHDIWYRLFMDKNLDYDFDIDVDEINQNNWTIFVTARICDTDKKFLGVCGVGEYLTSIQNILITDEQTYEVKINLVDQQGIVQIDSDSLNIEMAHIQNIINPNKSVQFELKEKDGLYVVTKFMPDLGLYLVVSQINKNSQSDFSNLIIHMTVCYAILLSILLIFLRVALKTDHLRVEEIAKKHGLASYADLYISMHLINLNENSINEISKNPKYDLISTDSTNNADSQLENAVRQIVALESLKTMLDFVAMDTLIERFQKNRVIQQEFRTREYGWCKAYFIVIDDNKNQEISEVIFAIELIDEEKNRENELLYLSQTDLMTGLKNRGTGEKAVQDLMAQGVEGMFCLLDADKFKSINDNYGHTVGDKVIKAIAECMKKTFRNTDITMRLGGDEFAVYVVGVIDEIRGELFIEDFFDEINNIEIPELGNRKISVSLGSAFFRVKEKLSFDELYKRADSATYESKKVQGNFHTTFKNEFISEKV